MHHLMTSALLLGLLAATPAAAESQSSNSSSNCSNGRCSRVESLVIDDGRGTRGYIREERWREGARWNERREQEARASRYQRERDRRRGRDDDDDDD
jgi:hypothetical protein